MRDERFKQMVSEKLVELFESLRALPFSLRNFLTQ
jgi:hypothetical protein